ncbi:uncharacterized protein LOC143343044 [Colletes latitarsis]|uniref:uncharacterized protein LOC143343044 n=1 Tax=Colletes latitarsis TaxID=2605962 RepID=UPI004035153B
MSSYAEPCVLSGESIESIHRAREKASRIAPAQLAAKMQVHVHVVCTDSTRVSFCVGWFVEVPAADRDRGNRDRDWDLKCYMNVCTFERETHCSKRFPCRRGRLDKAEEAE